MIGKMGFAGYFLIVWDFIRYAREHGNPVGRARLGGREAWVACQSRITDLGSISYNLPVRAVP